MRTATPGGASSGGSSGGGGATAGVGAGGAGGGGGGGGGVVVLDVGFPTRNRFDAVTTTDYNRRYHPQHHRSPPAIVIDNGGTYQCKAGFSVDSYPRLMFTPCVEGNSVVINWDEDSHNVTNPCSPFRNGLLVDPVCQEVILDYVFSGLGIDTASIEHPVVVSEVPCNTPAARSLMSELLFEVYGVPSVAYGVDALFSFIQNKIPARNALVISSGQYTTHVLPIVDGIWIPNLSKRLSVGGFHGTRLLQQFLCVKYPTLSHVMTNARAQHIKEHHMYTAPQFYLSELMSFADPDTALTKSVFLRIPKTEEEKVEELKKKRKDEKQLRALEQARKKQSEREAYLQRLREVSQLKPVDHASYERKLDKLNMTEEELRKAIHNVSTAVSRARKTFAKHKNFENPPPQKSSRTHGSESDDLEQDGSSADDDETEQQIVIAVERIRIPEIVFQPGLVGVNQMGLAEAIESVVRLWPACAQNVFITGGNTKFPCFDERLSSEIRRILPMDTPFNIYSARDAIVDAWRGGALLASDVSLHSTAAISRQQYQEEGPGCLRDSCVNTNYYED
ncbi:protein FAM210B [Pelomyxa schiedti]|nr:protein FAM210B [Pelomyxa schiedti]